MAEKLPIRAEVEIDVSKLKSLLEGATRTPWNLSGASLGDHLHITAYEREPHGREGDGPICIISTERTHYKNDRHGNSSETRSWKTPIIKARTDAQLIVEAINALPELLRRIDNGNAESAWLIEWPADDYGPVRYWAAGKPKPVIDVNKATRFSRREDATAVMGAHAPEIGCKVVEHIWTPVVEREAVDA